MGLVTVLTVHFLFQQRELQALIVFLERKKQSAVSVDWRTRLEVCEQRRAWVESAMEALSEAEVMDASTLPLTSAHLVAMAAGFLTVGYFLGRTHKSAVAGSRVTAAPAAGENAAAGAAPEKRRRRKEPLEVDRLAESHEDFKMVGFCALMLNLGECGSSRVSWGGFDPVRYAFFF